MQKNRFPVNKRIWLLPLIVAVFSLFGISSCKEKAPKGSCIALTKSQIIKAWEKSGHLKNIDYLTFITCYNPISHEIHTGVQAYNKLYQPIGSYVNLTTGDAWNDTLPPVAVGKNNLDFVELDILDKTGNLKDFAYINLEPFGDHGYLYYNTNVVDNKNKTLNLRPYTANPCPPCVNCKPPCPAGCTPACDKADSTKRKIPPYDTLIDSSGTN